MCIPRMMTVVVPSPTSSSCVRLSSIMLLAAGWETSISRRMAWPSLVRTMPPMGSSSIFSMALGPRHERMMSATLRGGSRLARGGARTRRGRVHLGGGDVGHLGLAAGLPIGATLAGVWSWSRVSTVSGHRIGSSSSHVHGGAVRGWGWGWDRDILITTTGACILGGPGGDVGYCVVWLGVMGYSAVAAGMRGDNIDIWSWARQPESSTSFQKFQ